MMSRYYADTDGIRRILRPMNGEELKWSGKFRNRLPAWAQAWEALYAGLLDWGDLNDEERRRITEPVGEGAARCAAATASFLTCTPHAA